jgi:integrase
MRIFIHHGKGGKDRYTLLSQRNLEALRVYIQTTAFYRHIGDMNKQIRSPLDTLPKKRDRRS